MDSTTELNPAEAPLISPDNLLNNVSKTKFGRGLLYRGKGAVARGRVTRSRDYVAKTKAKKKAAKLARKITRQNRK